MLDEYIDKVDAAGRPLTLCMDNCKGADDLTRSLRDMTTLEKLDLNGADLTDQGMPNLSRLTSLTELDLSRTLASDNGLAALRELTALRFVRLSRMPNVTGRCLAHLANLLDLRSFAMENDLVSDHDMEIVGRLPLLEEIYLRSKSLSGRFAQACSEMAHLHYLEIGGNGMTDEGFADICSLTRLRSLFVSGDLSDDGLERVQKLEALSTLGIESDRMTGAILRDLAKLKYLSYLDLRGRGLGDDAATSFGDLRALKNLVLANTGITSRGMQTIKRLLPQCGVLHR